MVFGFGLNHTSESSVRAKYTIYLPSFLAAIHYYVAFPLADIIFITKDLLLVPQKSRNVDVHREGSDMDIHIGNFKEEEAHTVIQSIIEPKCRRPCYNLHCERYKQLHLEATKNRKKNYI